MDILEIVKERLSIFKNLYDIIRIVDPIKKEVVNSEKDDDEIVEDSCYKLWGKDGYCKNCISMRAYTKNDTFIKIEQTGGEVFMVISSPVTIENNIYIVEMLKDLSKMGSIISNDKNIGNIENLIEEMNEVAVRNALADEVHKNSGRNKTIITV